MSDTYQSRVFSFISKRTNRLKDSCTKGWRHLKVAVVWTGQVLLYPLHLLAQTAKFFTHQLPATAPKSLLQPAPKLEIEQALTIVAAAGYEIAAAERPSSVVDDWSYIDDEIWQTGHGNAAVVSREITYQPRTIDRPQIVNPIVRGLSSLLSDRSIVLVTTENEILDVLNVFQQQEIRRRIGVDLEIDWHRWQQHRLQYRHARNLPGDEADLLLDGIDPQDLALLSGAEIPIDPERATTLFDRFQNWLDGFKPKPEDRQIFTVETTLQGRGFANERVPHQLTATSYPFTPQPPRLNRPIELPQLPPVRDARSIGAERTAVDFRSPLAPTWLKNWWNYYRDYLYVRPLADSQLVHRSTPTEFQLIPLAPQPQQTTTEIDRRKSDRQPESNPDWLDVEAEDLGTSRSLLQQILIWLDGLMLKIENWLIKIWEFITNKPAQN